jgi:hypothetical protein
MSEGDPTAPGWRPEYTGYNERLGDVGSGTRLGAHCYYLYRAGRNELPEVAVTYSLQTSRIDAITGSMRRLFDVPGHGMELAHLRLLELRDELQDVLRLTCLRLQEVGQALVTIAVTYAATDDLAVEEFTRLLDQVEDPDNESQDAREWRSNAPVVPDPPGLDSAPPGQNDPNQAQLTP